MGKKIRAILCIILWVAAIYLFSSQDAITSNHISTQVTRSIFTLKNAVGMNMINDKMDINYLNLRIRKAAHVFVYFILSCFVLRGLRVFGVKNSTRFIYAGVIVCVIAISDEYYQSLVPGRGPRVQDVMIDMLGFVLAVLGTFCWNKS